MCGALALAFLLAPAAGAARRLVILKVDGLPAGLVNRYVQEHDPATGKSRLPWIDYIFQRQGAIAQNFYVRGISLSVPSWSLLDTGQHLVIHGNAEYDRYTMRVYDYMNFFPFYVNYARSKRVDMPGVEVLDEAGVPLLIDRYPVEERYQGLQLYQRGIYWKTLQGSLIHRITSRSPMQLFNEWQSGFEVSRGVNEQIERELEARLRDPKVRYLDFFSGDYDHIGHLSNDSDSQYAVLRKIDALAGRIWTAIQSGPLAKDTIFVLVSDHGMNTDPSIYSQGYSLVDFFNSAEGGGHHVVTNRHTMTEFKLKGLDPFVSEVTNPSAHSLYLRDQAEQYPTVLLDLDGNERASVHLRNNRFNELQILVQRLSQKDLTKDARAALVGEFYEILDERRPVWDRETRELGEELVALKRKIALQRGIVSANAKRKWTEAERESGVDRDARREAARLRSWEEDFAGYTEYARVLSRLLAVEPARSDPSRFRIEDLIPKRSMGDPNTIYDLQNYVVGAERRVDYLKLLTSIRVRNNVQAGVGDRPIDLIAVPAGPDKIWLYESEESQALIFSRPDELRIQPVRGLTQDPSGELHYSEQPWRAGLPLRLLEDADLNVPGDRAEWLSSWHSEREWLEATHRTFYSNAVIGLHEQLSRAKLRNCIFEDPVLCRFEQRKFYNLRADMLVLASNHWNFNVRGFNPGGNHGGFFRVSTHSVLMLAGAGIPQGLTIERPYDSLSFVPTVLSLAGELKPGELERYPGPVIEELAPAAVHETK